MTKVAWHLKKNEIRHSDPSEAKEKFLYHVSSSGYRKDWGDIYEKPGFGARAKAFFLRLTPKVGPFSGLAFHPPTPAVERLYMNSFNETLESFRELLLAQQQNQLRLANDNLDKGETTVAADYRLTDDAYAQLLKKLSGKSVSSSLRQDLLAYYADPAKQYATKKKSKAWREVLREVDVLKSTPSDAPASGQAPD